MTPTRRSTFGRAIAVAVARLVETRRCTIGVGRVRSAAELGTSDAANRACTCDDVILDLHLPPIRLTVRSCNLL